MMLGFTRVYRISIADAYSNVMGEGVGRYGDDEGKRIRDLADRITIALVVALAMLIFMISIPFLPGNSLNDKQSSPFLVALVSAGIGVLMYFGRSKAAGAISWVIIIGSISWHLFNLGVLTLMDPRVSTIYPALSFIVVGIVGLLILYSLAAARRDPLVFAASALALSITLTPYYYIAIPVMLLPIIIRRDIGIATLVLSIIAIFTPFLFAENALSFSLNIAGQSPSTINDPLRSLSEFASSYQPYIFTYMGNVDRFISNNGPLPALDPASLFILLANRWYSQYNNITAATAQQSSISSTIFPSAVPILAFLLTLSTAQSIVVISRLITALVAFAIVVVISGIVSTYIPRMVKRIPVLEEKRGLVDLIAPVITLLLGSIIFIILLLGISPPLRITTMLATQPLATFNTALISILIGGVFTAREYLIQKLESVSLARQRLSERLDRLESIIEEVSREISSVLGAVSGIEVNDEKAKVEEARAFIKDARSRLGIVGLNTLKSFEERASNYYDEIQRVRGSLKNKVIGQLGSLRAIASRGNNQLGSLGLGSPFPEPEEISAMDDLEKILEIYRRYIDSLRKALEDIYSSYLTSLESIARMMPQEGLLKPATSPLSLYDLGERLEALNITIDLWIRLGEIHWNRAKGKLAQVARYLEDISGNTDPELAGLFKNLSESAKLLSQPSTPPSKALDAEKILRDAIDLSLKACERIRSDIEYISDLIRDLAPEVIRVMKFSVLQETKDVEELEKAIHRFDGSLAMAQEILKSLSMLASTHRSNMRQDEERIVLLVAYPIARTIIEERLSETGRVSITELPFSPQASALYAKIYSETSKKTQYIEYLGVIEAVEREVAR